MSWDRSEYDEKASCVCGNGFVVRHMYIEDDDWNRSRSGCTGEEIICPDCSAKYHIRHEIKHFFCPSWKGDGISDRIFLVPNGVDFTPVMTAKDFSFPEFDKEIVSLYTRESILSSIDDMKKNRFSTRLDHAISRDIVKRYSRRFKTRKLMPIISELESAVMNYEDYEWNPKTIDEYRKKERVMIDQSQKNYEEAIKQSYELFFERG